ncbi:MAG TPA: GGDEF domain-containing protein [Vicinamibacteria bacterium]|nr:GGDEF domain-containing protein [Vicinamibacteria bacterium]
MRLHASRPWPRRWLYAAAAALLSTGAPLGLLLVRGAAIDRAWPERVRDVLAADPAAFTYVTLSTLSVFLVFGYVLGRQADRLLALAQTDPLTGLRNTRAFEERLVEETARARRYRHPLSLLFIDVDGLKAINDRGGHLSGDRALVRVATALRDTARSTDLAARWGGDEFALLAPDTTAAAGVTLGERIRALVSASAGDAGEAMTVSVGVGTTLGEEDATAELLRARADAALYAAKRRGRDRVIGTERPAGSVA